MVQGDLGRHGERLAIADALDPASLPSATPDTLIGKTYSPAGDFLAFIDSQARLSASAAPNQHLNNPDGGYRVETRVNVGTQGPTARR